MEPTATATSVAWRPILRAYETMQEYFAQRSTLHDAVLFTCAEAEEFNVALVDDVVPGAAAPTLAAIVRHYRARGTTPRIRLSPLAAATDWPERLTSAGFVETGEQRRFWVVPTTLQLVGNPAVRVTRATTPAEADRFSAIQAAGYGLPPAVQDWDRRLTRRHLAAGRDRFYLAWLDEEAVGAAASMPLAAGMTGLWGLATLPGDRHRGVGTAILARMIDDARAAADGPIFFTTAWANPIEPVYARLGFVPLFRTRTFEQRS